MSHSDIRRIINPLFLLVRNNAIIAALAFTLSLTLANLLGPEIFGIYSYALLVASILSILINFGMDQTAPVSYASLKDEKKVFENVYLLKISIAVACFVGLLVSSIFGMPILYYVFCLAFANFNLAFLYEIRKRNERYSYILLVERVSYISIAFLFIYHDLLYLHYFFTALLIVSVSSTMFQLFDSRKFVGFCTKSILKPSKQVLLNNFPLVIVSLSLFMYGGFSRLILENELGTEMLGVYSAGWQLITIGTIFQGQVSRIWRIRISETVISVDFNRLKNEIGLYFVFTTVPMIFIGLLFLFGADYIVDLIYSDAYKKLSTVVPIFGAYLVVINLAGLVNMLWVAIRENFIYMLCNLIFSLTLLVILSFFSSGWGIVEFASVAVILHFLSTLALALIWFPLFKQKMG